MPDPQIRMPRPGPAGLDGIGQLAGEIGIVDGSGAICARIQPLHIGQSDFQGFFEGKAPMIAANGYGVEHFHALRLTMQCSGWSGRRESNPRMQLGKLRS
jgi:hypothetical protein